MVKKRQKKTRSNGFFKKEHWPKLRAAIIAYFVLFDVLAAVPSPGNVTQEMLDRPITQAELRRWVNLFGAIGIETNPKSLGDWYIGFANGMERARAQVVKPIEWWMTYTQTWQGWRLFGMPDERPYALEIRVKRGAKDEVLYRSGDPDHRWNASFLEYRRVRAAYNPGNSGPPDTYRGFAIRVSDQIFEEMPDVDQVTFTLLQSHTTLPGEPPDPEVKSTYPMTFPRKKK